MTDWSNPSRRVPRQRAIFDRRALAGTVSELAETHGENARPQILDALKAALDTGHDELEKRLTDKPSAGHEITLGYAFLTDQLIRVIHDYVVTYVFPVANRTTAERLAILAVGGYGRAEMAPHSDIDIAFITPMKPVALVRAGDRGDALSPVGSWPQSWPFEPYHRRHHAHGERGFDHPDRACSKPG